MKPIFFFLLAMFAIGSTRAEKPPLSTTPTTDLAAATLVLFNGTSEPSFEVAKHYAQSRGIPAERLFGLETEDTESILPAKFQSQIREPLRDIFTARGWDQGAVRVLVTCRGLPYRIGPRTHEEGPASASVDSELAHLLMPPRERAGAGMPNPYFGSKLGLLETHDTFLIVGRLDGPSWEIARQLVDDAIATEAVGLWGFGCFDQWNSGRPGYGTGDTWIDNAFRLARGHGLPCLIDRNKSRFTTGWPIRHCALYLGWYTWNIDGPFKDPDFRLQQGAIATHLHSFSASHLRQDEISWTGPLLARGAAGVLGNVAEPYLNGTTHLDRFAARLLSGATLGEAAWSATPMLGWMNLVVGDPLYRPFGPVAEPSETKETGFALWQRVVRGDQDALTRLQENIGSTEPDPFLLEFAGLHALHEGNQPEEAFQLLQRAAQLHQDPSDRLRPQLVAIDWLRLNRGEEHVVPQLQQLLQRLPENDTGSRRSVRALLQQIDPPPPPRLRPGAFAVPDSGTKTTAPKE